MEVIRVAVPGPFAEGLDYRLPVTLSKPVIGARVQVPLGRRQLVGVVIGEVQSSDIKLDKLKALEAILDPAPIFHGPDLKLLQWAAQYYHCSIGDMVHTALPQALTEARPFEGQSDRYWCITRQGSEALASLKAPKQRQALMIAAQHPEGVDRLGWQAAEISLSIIKALVEKFCLEEVSRPASPVITEASGQALQLNPAQSTVLAVCLHHLGKFAVKLLEGVTGSGKTEIYLQLIAEVLARGQQALVLVPEIGLTPQMLQRFKDRFAVPIVVLHSGLTESERLQHWYWAARGEAKVIIGTRSAIFVPCQSLGVIIVDEEHDLSFKQQTGVRYSARDLAVLRGQYQGVLVLLGSATPSLESLHNANLGKYGHLQLPARAGNAMVPKYHLIDLRQQPMQAGLSRPLLSAMTAHMQAGGQVLIFLNRRGYAPVLMCHACGWIAACKHCDAYYTLHQRPWHLSCHHCGATHSVYKACQECQELESLIQVGVGTEKVEEALSEIFPQYPIARIDRGSIQKKGSLETLLNSIHSGEARILIGTQMLAKGHHFAGVTMVGVLNMDAGLFSSDFRALEHTGQLLLQVAGRSGREERQGEVYIQTHHPEHPLLRVLLEQGYHAFAHQLLAERSEALWPPFSHLALLRAEAKSPELASSFLRNIKLQLMSVADENSVLLGPVPALMQKRAGMHRLQLLIRSASRRDLHIILAQFEAYIHSQKHAGIRWSIDVDPQEL